MPNGGEAAVCFWALTNQCVFAPLNPALTLHEVEFELVDLPCHTMILMKDVTKHYPSSQVSPGSRLRWSGCTGSSRVPS